MVVVVEGWPEVAKGPSLRICMAVVSFPSLGTLRGW